MNGVCDLPTTEDIWSKRNKRMKSQRFAELAPGSLKQIPISRKSLRGVTFCDILCVWKPANDELWQLAMSKRTRSRNRNANAPLRRLRFDTHAVFRDSRCDQPGRIRVFAASERSPRAAALASSTDQTGLMAACDCQAESRDSISANTAGSSAVEKSAPGKTPLFVSSTYDLNATSI